MEKKNFVNWEFLRQLLMQHYSESRCGRYYISSHQNSTVHTNDFFFFSLFSVPLFKGFQVVLVVKKPPANAGDIRDQLQSLGREDPLEEVMATHSCILAWRILWTEKPGGLQSMGLQRVGHNWSMHTPLFKWAPFSGEKNLNPPTEAQSWLSVDISAETCSCLSCTLFSSHSSYWLFCVLVFMVGQPQEPALPSVWSGTCHQYGAGAFLLHKGRW